LNCPDLFRYFYYYLLLPSKGFLQKC